MDSISSPINYRVDDLLTRDQFQLPQKEKERILFSILKPQITQQIAISKNMNYFYKKLNFNINNARNISDIPPLPVQMFKKYDLRTCSQEDIIRILNSSATTTGIPSKIFVDKTTAFRQSKGLTSTVKGFVGKQRRPFLVIDEDINKQNSSKLTARAAAIRGFSNFAKSTTYAFDNVNGKLTLNKEGILEFVEANENNEVLAFGFTYIIWIYFIAELKKQNIQLNLPKIKILHGGGWKKLKEQSVTKEEFNLITAKYFNTQPSNIIDYYGMVEQLGVVFLDCEFHNKHVPDFADIIIRDYFSMKEVQFGGDGLIECLSVLPTSYPGQAIITEDIGKILGIDDCPCGRKGKYFTFVSRAEKTEIRGCGDTFAEKNTPQNTNTPSSILESSTNIKDDWDY